jgi:hypothetical protein
MMVAAGLLGSASAVDAQCHAKQYAAYAVAQREYQFALERLVSEADTSLRSIAAIARQEQVTRINARERAFMWALSNRLTSLRLDLSINQWLDWGRAEAEELAKVDREFAKLDQLNADARAMSAGHSDWPRLRAVVRDRVSPMPAHRAAMEKVMAFTRSTTLCPR